MAPRSTAADCSLFARFEKENIDKKHSVADWNVT